MTFSIQKKDPNSRARAGVLRTKHGELNTPAYVIVGTHAKVRCLGPQDLEKTKTQIVIANTYHLWQKLRSSQDINFANFPGLHKYMNWSKPIMTDSGGFQVFSLGLAREHGVGKIANIFPDDQGNPTPRTPDVPNIIPPEGSPPRVDRTSEVPNIEPQKNLVRVTPEGVYFQAEDGKEQFLGPKESIKIQENLGADIILAFDECTSPLNDYEYTKQALARTHKWEKECLRVKTRDDQLLFGIVQGGKYKDLREDSAKFISNLPFDGLAIGGSLGKSRSDMLSVLDWTIPLLPENKPRHLLGIGKIEDLFDGIERGVDTFDCVIPTREARHGRIWKKHGHFDILKSKHANDTSPLDPECECPTCIGVVKTSDVPNIGLNPEGSAQSAQDIGRLKIDVGKGITKQTLHQLFKSKHPNAARLATIHNIFFFNTLMEQIRTAIKENKFQELKKEHLSNL